MAECGQCGRLIGGQQKFYALCARRSLPNFRGSGQVVVRDGREKGTQNMNCSDELVCTLRVFYMVNMISGDMGQF